MRLQIMPLILCLLFTTFGKSQPKLSYINSTELSAIGLAKSIQATDSGSEFYDANTFPATAKKGTPQNGIFSYGAAFDLSHANFTNEENSYKYNSNFTSSSLSSAQFSTFQQTASANLQVIFSQGLYYGFAIMLILLNVVCFFLFDEKPFLFYALSLASLTAVFFFSDGLLTVLGFDPIMSSEIVQASLLGLASAMAAFFASKYLALDEIVPKLKWVIRGMYAITGLLLFTAWVTNDVAIAKTATIVMFAAISTYFIAGVYLFSKKNYAKFYVIATSIPLLFAIDFFVLRPLGIVFLSTETIHLKWAALAEMLILTYAIMYRMQAIKEEHELRQAELRIFLKRQEVMASRKGTENLIEDVYLENLIMHYDLDGLEIKLLQYISEGKDNAKIARKLKTTENEIEELTKELYQKLEIGEHIQEDFRMLDSQPDYIYN